MKKNYKTVTDIQQVLTLWYIRKLTLEEKLVIFKTIVMSKIVFQSFITTIRRHIMSKRD